MSFKTYTHHTVYPSLDDRGGGRSGAGGDPLGGNEAYQLSQCLAQKIVLGESPAEVLPEAFNMFEPALSPAAVRHFPHQFERVGNLLLSTQKGALAFVAGQHLLHARQRVRSIQYRLGRTPSPGMSFPPNGCA